jgi:hypothetical protein
MSEEMSHNFDWWCENCGQEGDGEIFTYNHLNTNEFYLELADAVKSEHTRPPNICAEPILGASITSHYENLERF